MPQQACRLSFRSLEQLLRGNVPTVPRDRNSMCRQGKGRSFSVLCEEKVSVIFSHPDRPIWKLFLDKWKQVNPHLSVTLAKQGMSSNLI